MDTLNFTNNGAFSIADSSTVNVAGTGHVIGSIGSNATVGIYTPGGALVGVSGIGDNLTLGGNGQNCNANSIIGLYYSSDINLNIISNSTVYIQGPGFITANISSNDTVTTFQPESAYAQNDYNINGGGNITVNGTGDFVTVGGNGQNAVSANVYTLMFASSGTFAVADNSTVAMSGAGNLTGSVGNNVTLACTSTGGGKITLNGTGVILTIGGNGQSSSNQSDYVNISNTGDTLNILDNSSVVVTGWANASVAIGANASVGYYSTGGGNLTINGANDVLTIGNYNNAASAALEDIVTFNANGKLFTDLNTRIDIYGAGTVTASIGANSTAGFYTSGGGSVTLTGPNDILTIGGNGQNATTTMDIVTFNNGGFLTETANASANMYGANLTAALSTNDTLGLHAGCGNTVVSGFGSTDNLHFDKSVFANWAQLIAGSKQSGGNTIITESVGNTITLSNFALCSLTQSQVSFV